MTTKDTLELSIQLLGILFSWPVMFLVVTLLVRRELPALISKLAERITKAPGGFEFANLQQRVDTLTAKVETLEKIRFEPSAALTPALQARLQSAVDAFQSYFAKLGYQSRSGHVVVFVDPDLKDNVYYDSASNRIVLGEPLAEDTDAVCREYSHHALFADRDLDAFTEEQLAIESGLADYFPCSFNNDPLFGEKSVHLFRDAPQFRDKPAIRNLENDRTFAEAVADPEHHHVGEIWGGAFWELRSQLGAATLDTLLFAAWQSVRFADKAGDAKTAFVRQLLETAASTGGAAADRNSRTIRAVFERRGVKL